MTDWEIRPLVGLGEIRFGMTAIDVKNLLGAPSSTFKKTPSAAHETDAYDTLGLHIYYDSHGHCEAIEMATPAMPFLNGHSLLDMTYIALIDWLKSIDSTAVEDDGLLCPQLGISLYAPLKVKDPQKPVEAILLFRSGYYD